MENPKEDYLKHYKDLGVDLPFWVAVDVLKFGDFARLFVASDGELRMSVAKNFGIKAITELAPFSRKIKQMTFVRNYCAHGARLYNRVFASKPSLDSRTRRLLRIDEKGKPDDYHVFAYILLFKVFLESSEYETLKKEIRKLCKTYPFVDLKYCGFPETW